MLNVAAIGGFLQSVAVVLLCLLSWTDANLCSAHGSSQGARCLCASDILSCSAIGLEKVPKEMPVSVVTLDLSHNRIVQLDSGAFQGLYRLDTLRLAHNKLTHVHPGAFKNSSGALLRHLDLSSNQLRVLEPHYFTDLPGLEELLLFNNRIAHVETNTVAGWGNLRKAYLSHNRLTDFPFFVIQEHSHPHLSMLDLSSNRLSKLPLEDISNLPMAVQRGLYLHNNSLLCECSMYALFKFWEKRDFLSIKELRSEYTCLVHGIQRGTVRFFQHNRYFEKCNQTVLSGFWKHQESDVSVKLGNALLLHCVTSLSGQHVTFLWVAPNQEYVAPPGNNGSLKMFANGSLEIKASRDEDSGIYWCMALDEKQQRNESREINVTVILPPDYENQESFNTGFTTLLGCVVSLVLVLMYLFLTPCRCPLRRKIPTPTTATPSQPGNEAASAQSSILTPTPPTTTEGPGRKVSTNKHVVFLEPIREQQNGRLLRIGQGLLLGAEQQHSFHTKKTESTVSPVFLDTPIIVT